MTKTNFTMDRVALRTFCLCLLFLVFTGTKDLQCENRWFGDKCQYQCHCLNNAICNKTTGDCPGVCDKGWFGPQCQYRDAAYYNKWVRLTDGDESTCLVGDVLFQYFTMLDNVMFTWMRIVTNKPGLFNQVNMTFLSNNGTKVEPKSTLTKIYVSDTILELYGELQHRFQSIRLDFNSRETKHSFCSMYVSSGRNVALKQSASQSSTASMDGIVGGAERAVDGKPQQWWGGGSCTFTGVEDSSYWTLSLPLDVTVNVYTILGRNEQGILCRLRYFRLESYNQSTKVQQYDQKEPLNKVNYEVYPLGTTPVTSVILSVSTDFWPNKQYLCHDNAPRLSFCEMQIYGDVVCKPGKWGRDCEKNCNCQDPCFVSTGMCPSRCKAGFQGHGCQEVCPDGQWGLDCLNSCDNCLDGRCNKAFGECQSECIPGYKLPFCVEKCDPGFYDTNCNVTCPANCQNSICDHVNGTCTKCVAGYQGSMCNQECNTTYYGEDCATQCNDKCIDQLCDHITGVCDDCPDGKQISKNCSQDCSPGYFGPNCTHQCNDQCGGVGFCNYINGSCLSGCKPGYRTDNCEEPCDNTTYGEDCSRNCSVNCVVNATQEPAICGHVNGQCLLGCVPGYSGMTCEEIPSDEINPAAVVVPILVVILLVAALIFGIWFWRRRKAQKTDGEEIGSSHLEKRNGNNMELGSKAQQSTDYLDDTNLYEIPNEDEVNVYSEIPETLAKFSKTAIRVDFLENYLASHDMDYFRRQFERVPDSRATTSVAESSMNKHKNRYRNIPAYDHSKVRLQEDTEKKQGDYYNANFIQGYDGAKYIASQAPNKEVLNDFIRMIWEQNVELVVMLTKVVEDGKAKCESYWPTNDPFEETFGEITVKLAATQVLAEYTKRTLQLTKNDGQSRFVTQYHFTSWPDKGVPETPWALVDFEQVVDYHYDTEKPLLVHCSAGVGRSGTFIALRNVLKEAKATGYVDFFQAVAKMRQDRISMIQTVEQYRFLHDAVQVALLCQDALMTTAAFDDRMKVLMEKSETGQTEIEKEFKMVCDLAEKENWNVSENETTEYASSVATDQNFMTNIKNRFSTVLAKKEHRPKLSFDPENDYINAVLVPSMMKKDQQVLTQLPLPNTVEDFWSLVIQYNVSLIVAFDSDKENKDNPVGDYLPKNNEPMKCGNFEISGDKVTRGDFWEKEKIHVQAKSTDKNLFYVHHIKCTKSKLDTNDWLVFLKELHSMAPLGDDRTLYMCMNGADLSGFACVLSLLINRVDHDHFLTVPLVVGKIKSIRPEVIPNKDQYICLYKILQLHCERAHAYTNQTPALLSLNK